MKTTQTQIAVLIMVLVAAGLAAQAAHAEGVVNVNTAGLDELMLLPRVGPSVAQRIIDHREKNGDFKVKEDLMLVRGIGEATFALLEPYVTISGATTLTEKVRSTKKDSEKD